MKKLFSLLAVWVLALTTAASGQIVETRPAPLQQSSKDVVVVYHSDRGNGGLKGFTGDMYAHIGVITDKSNGQWVYAPAKWGDNSEKYKLTPKGNDTWELAIGDIRTYFGITDATETVEKLAMVFRSADTKKEGKTETGGDIFVDVNPDGFVLDVNSTASSVLLSPTKATVNATTTEEADITITLDGIKVASKKGTTLSAEISLSERRTYKVIVTADNGKETLTSELTFLVAPQAVKADYPGGVPQQGAVEADGKTRFCIAAPGKENVIIVGSWDNYSPNDASVMKYQDYNGYRYFWAEVEGLEKGKNYCYYYLVDGTKKVGDPYARLVLDPYSDKWLDKLPEGCPAYPYDRFDDTMLAVYNSDIDNYDWQYNDAYSIPDHDKLIIYELLVRDFDGANRTADGTFDNVSHRLLYLKELGVNAIELMPVMEFNGNNSWGYNTNFYMAPDKAYGSPADLRALIDNIHRHGMAVILDIVFNQSDGLHPWYQMYDIKNNPFYNEKAPHDYSVLNDWNQSNPLVEQHWADVIRYWMTAYNVDGFRFDLVKGLGDNDSYSGGTEAYNKSRVDRMTRLHAVITSVKPDGIHINEHLAGAKEETEMAADGQLQWANMSNASCQTAMGYIQQSDMSAFYAPRHGSRPYGSTVSYAESHDEERMGYKQTQWGATDDVKADEEVRSQRLGMVAALMLMTPGNHMIWQFGELGADQTTKNTDGGNNTDPKTVLWGRLENGNWANLLQTYTNLNWIRRLNPALFSADTQVDMSYNGWTNGRHIRLTAGNQELLLLANPTTDEMTVEAAVTKIAAANNRVMTSTPAVELTPAVTDGKVSCKLPAGTFVIIGTADTAGIDGAIGDAPTARAIGGNGRITIVGEYDTVSVYSISGAMTGLEGLTPGIYVVDIDGRASKVLVR